MGVYWRVCVLAYSGCVLGSMSRVHLVMVVMVVVVQVVVKWWMVVVLGIGTGGAAGGNGNTNRDMPIVHCSSYSVICHILLHYVLSRY